MGSRKKKMDANWVARVKAEGLQEDWYDELSPIGVSLILRVSRTGRKVWTARYRPRDEEKHRRFKLGEYPAMSLADARERVSGIHAGLSGGADPSREREEWKKAPTFGKLAEEYIERYAKLSKRSWERDEELLKRNALPAWDKRLVSSIKRRDVIELLDGIMARMKEGQRGIPANRTLAVLRKLFNWAISQDLMESNPCHQVKAPAAEQARDRVLSDDEIRRAWLAFEKIGAEARRAAAADILKIMLLTAQRSGEVKTMRWEDLDLAGGWWTIPAESAKNGLSHRVPLSATVRTILEARKAQAETKARKVKREGDDPHLWVFPSRGVGGPVNEIKKSAAEARDLSGCDWTPHDLRRTAASHMASMGIQRLVISKILNHVERGVTAVYERHSYDHEKRQALEAWDRRLRGILNGKQKL